MVLSYLLDLQMQYVSLIAFVLIWHSLKISRVRLPHAELQTVIYTGRNWLLKFKNGDVASYQEIKIRLDTGFFCVIAFCNKPKFKNIVIFNDQITVAERRMLNVLEKVGNKA